MSAPLLAGSRQLLADTHAVTTPEGPSSPDPADRSGPLVSIPTALGELDGLFNVSGSGSAATLQVLERATDSMRGPFGGLRPSSLQHQLSAAVSRVDGDATPAAVGAEAQSTARAAASRVRADARGLMARVRSLVHA